MQTPQTPQQTHLSELNYDQCKLLLRWIKGHDWFTRGLVVKDGLRIWDEFRGDWITLETLEAIFDHAGYEPDGIREALDDYA